MAAAASGGGAPAGQSDVERASHQLHAGGRVWEVSLPLEHKLQAFILEQGQPAGGAGGTGGTFW